jgi:deoxyribonuclease-4
MGAGVREGLCTVIESLDNLLKDKKEFKVQLLAETTAGQGSSLGCTFEQLAEILEGVKETRRLGVCIDTCHVFAAGYDLRTAKSYEMTMKEVETVIGLEKVKAFHLNDSKRELGCRVDRHAGIGEGYLGIVAFERAVNDPRFSRIPSVIEIPGDKHDDLKSLRLLKQLRRQKNSCQASIRKR